MWSGAATSGFFFHGSERPAACSGGALERRSDGTMAWVWTGCARVRRSGEPVVALAARSDRPDACPRKRWKYLTRTTGNVVKLLKRRRRTKAFDKLEEMLEGGEAPNLELFNRLLRTCAATGSRKEAEYVLQLMREIGVPPDATSYAQMVRVYDRTRNPALIGKLLETMRNEEVSMRVDVYNAMISSCVTTRNRLKAREFVRSMHETGVRPNVRTFELLAVLLLRVGDVEGLKDTFRACKRSGVPPSGRIYSCLLTGASRSMDVDLAEKVLHHIQRRGMHPELGALVALAKLCAHLGRHRRVEEIFAVVETDGTTRADLRRLYNACFEGMCAGGRFEGAARLRQQMKEKSIQADSETAKHLLPICAHLGGTPADVYGCLGDLRVEGVRLDATAYSGLVAALAVCDDVVQVDDALAQMFRDGVVPTVQTYDTALMCFARHRSVGRARSALRWMRRDGKRPSREAYSAAMRMFAELDSVADLDLVLLDLFHRKRLRLSADVSELVATAYERAGRPTEARQLERMRQAAAETKNPAGEPH